jgi:cell division protein ZapD
VILYEYPFNERIRTYLRLEHLFHRLGELAVREHPTDHHYAITTIFEVMDVAARADLKTDVLKDLDRQKHTLNGYRGNPAISEAVLDEVTAQLDGCFAALNSLPGKAGQSLTENDWLMSIRSRIGIPGGTCEFDLPAYFAWQHLDAQVRKQDLQRWIATLVPLAESVRMLLKLLRDSGLPQKVVAAGGQFLKPGLQFRSHLHFDDESRFAQTQNSGVPHLWRPQHLCARKPLQAFLQRTLQER